MSRDWKPGDIGLIPFAKVDEVGFFVEGGWVTRLNLQPLGYENARPLVVIDPESSEQVVRLLASFVEAVDASFVPAHPQGWSVPSMQAALREFANPTPPRPEEPTGLGAVVEDEDGRKWIRTEDPAEPWCAYKNREEDDYERWADIAVVRVLSEGVTA